MARELRVAKTVEQVIETLGGAAATASITKRTVQAVSNWKSANRLPSWSYLTLSKKLAEHGCKAPPSLWGIKEPAEAAE
jgi:hypothetical protein